MKILSVSDFVVPELQNKMDRTRFAGLDLVISCGDLPPEYLTFLYTTFDVPVLYIKGNHDIRYSQSPPAGCSHINARVISTKGVNILGLDGSRWYNGGPNQYTEAQMKWTVRKLRPTIWWHKKIDIVVAHAPPRHIHDAEDPCHRGFKTFRWVIDRLCPNYFLHGHLHEHFSDPTERITRIGRTQVINTCGYYLFETGHG